MMGKKFQKKYALTDKGFRNMRIGAAWTVVVNLIMMAGMGILYFLMQGYMDTLTNGAALPNAWIFLGLVAAFIVLSFFTHLEQYKTTYGLVYKEVKDTRISLAERLRRLPLGYFGKRDLADLTETVMGDVNRLEHVWSHCLGYLYGAYISTAIIAVMLLVYDWRMALACLWGVPVAFLLLFGSRRIQKRASEKLKADALAVKFEKTNRRGELVIGLFVNAASVIMRLGVATTILTGASLILSGKIDFMLMFMFLMVITRVYAPFDQALALIAEMFVSQVSANRLNEINDTPTAEGTEEFKPDGHDIVFENVAFAYDDHDVLNGVSFTAKEGEVTALVGPSGSGKSTCARLAARLWDISKGYKQGNNKGRRRGYFNH